MYNTVQYSTPPSLSSFPIRSPHYSFSDEVSEQERTDSPFSLISSCTLESTIGEPVAPQPLYIGIESIDTYFRNVLGYGFVNKYERTVGENQEYRHVYCRYKWGLSQEISSGWQQSVLIKVNFQI